MYIMVCSFSQNKEKKMKRRASKLKKEQSQHGVILQGTERVQPRKIETRTNTEDHDDDEEENLKKLKEKVCTMYSALKKKPSSIAIRLLFFVNNFINFAV